MILIILDILKDTDWIATAGFILCVLSIIVAINGLISKSQKRLMDEIIENRNVAKELAVDTKNELALHSAKDDFTFKEISGNLVQLRDIVVETKTKVELLIDDKIKK